MAPFCQCMRFLFFIIEKYSDVTEILNVYRDVSENLERKFDFWQ